MKRGIALANQPNTTKEAVAAFHASLKRARDEVVADCRAERKRARAKQSSADLSDASMRAAAQFTDNLPLANYDGILHLVPRLVNVVTVSSQASNTQPVQRSNALSVPRRSSQRRSPSPAQGSSCRSTCTRSAHAAATRTLLPAASPRSSSPSATRAAASWCFVSADQTRTRCLDPLACRTRPACACADTGRLVGTGARAFLPP